MKELPPSIYAILTHYFDNLPLKKALYEDKHLFYFTSNTHKHNIGIQPIAHPHYQS
jgi:hypothetical protein